MYRFLPLKHQKTMEKDLPSKGPGIELSPSGKDQYRDGKALPQRSPSMIAQDVISGSIYKHRQEEERKKSAKKRYILIGVICVVVFVLLLTVVVAVLATVLGKKPALPIPPSPSVLEMWPKLNSDGGIPEIVFKSNDVTTYRSLMDDIHTKGLERYRSSVMPGKSNCSKQGLTLIDKDSNYTGPTCPYPLKDLGSECTFRTHKYGYSNGTPCILLALNVKDYWDPSLCDNTTIGSSDGNDTTPPPAPEYAKVTCKELGADEDSRIGSIEINPKNGFPQYLLSDPRYDKLPPLVMLRILNVTRQKETEVRCSMCGGTAKESSPKYSVKFRLKVG